MNISLTPELEKLVTEKVESGMYHTASEVVREGLRLLKEQDELRQRRVEALQAELKVGLDQLKRGEGISGDRVFAELRRKSSQRRQKKA